MPWQLFEGNIDKISGLRSDSLSDRPSSGNEATLLGHSLSGNDSSALAANSGTVSHAEFLARIVSLSSIVISVCSLLVKLYRKARRGRFASGMVSRIVFSVYSTFYCIAVTVKLLGRVAKAVCCLNVHHLSREAACTSQSTSRPLSAAINRDDSPSSPDTSDSNSSSDVDSATAQERLAPIVRRPIRLVRNGGLLNAAMRLIEKQEDPVVPRKPFLSSQNAYSGFNSDDADSLSQSEETWEVGTAWKRKKSRNRKDWKAGQKMTWVREAEMREMEEEEHAVESMLTCTEQQQSTSSSNDTILLNPKPEQDGYEQQGTISFGGHFIVPAVPAAIQESEYESGLSSAEAIRSDEKRFLSPGIGATALASRYSQSLKVPNDVGLALTQTTTKATSDSGTEAAPTSQSRRLRRRGCRGSKKNKKAAAASADEAQLASD